MNPEHSDKAPERTLVDIDGGVQNLQQSCGWPHADAVLAAFEQRICFSQCLAVIEELEGHVRSMGIASRFRRDKYFDEATAKPLTGTPQFSHLDISFGDGIRRLNEAGHKRAQLLLNLRALHSRYISLSFLTLKESV